MTGFKSGASDDDPLADDGADDQDDDRVDDAVGTTAEPELGQQTSTETTVATTDSGGGLPWIYQRNSITDGRAKTVQLHLQQSTLDRELNAQRDVPIDDSVNKADLREAAYLVGLQHLDDVADQLREWGYDAD